MTIKRMAGMPSNMELVGQSLHDLLTTLRTMYSHYQNLHWESKGDSFYSDHLLFQRLYETVQKEVDGLAEKILGLTGDTRWVCLRHTLQHGYDTAQIWYEVAGEYGASRALLSETYLLEQIDYIKAVLEKEDSMTYGLDDFLGSVSSQHEEHIYLLRRRMTKSASAGKYFHDSPVKREVREFQQSGAKTNLSQSCSDQTKVCTPPTPSDVLDEGGREFSTLSRYVIDTAQPTKKPMPSSRSEIPKQARTRLTRSSK